MIRSDRLDALLDREATPMHLGVASLLAWKYSVVAR